MENERQPKRDSKMTNAFLATESWQQAVARTLPAFGHRNWIVVADSAYPQQARQGVRTIVADTDQAHAVQTVLSGIEESWHVRPIIHLDQELDFLDEADAPGIGKYRDWLIDKLKEHRTTAHPHEEIIARVDEAAERFQVLVVKSHMALPYTSVFFELDCGYWNPEAEARLRARIGEGNRGQGTGNGGR
jgi:hypothetical protein